MYFSINLRAADIEPPPSGSGIPCFLEAAYIPVPVPPELLSLPISTNQTLAWLSVDVCALGPHSCLLASPAWIAVVGGNSSVDVASGAAIASGGGH